MGEEIFSELETKIDTLISKVQNYKQENNELKQEIELQKGMYQELELESATFKEEFQDLKNSLEDRQKKLDNAASKIQGLLSKLESVE